MEKQTNVAVSMSQADINTENKDKLIARIGTFVVHAILILIFIFLKSTPPPQAENMGGDGIVIDFGDTPNAGGDGGAAEPTPPTPAPPTPQPQEVSPPKPDPKPSVVTSDDAESIRITKEKEKKAKEEKARQETEARQRAEQAAADAEADELFNRKPGKGSGGGKGTGKGDGTGPGDQGDASGVEGGGKGLGYGPIQGLRKVVSRCDDVDGFFQVEGVVMVETCIDRQGNVTSAKVSRSKGTTIEDPTTHDLALRCVKSYRFAAKPNGQVTECGLVPIKFKVK